MKWYCVTHAVACDAEDEDSRDEGHSELWRQEQATPTALCQQELK